MEVFFGRFNQHVSENVKVQLNQDFYFHFRVVIFRFHVSFLRCVEENTC